MNNFIKVNSEKCTKCGLCVKICRGTLVIIMGFYMKLLRL
ncbi:4Fe-4S binding protein [Clostridium beijerinckii]|nr:4Fe-4S binding protein [Clostridium beijerinckii]